MAKFDHIKLGRAFRPHVLATIKDLPSWGAYLVKAGFAGRSQDMTNGEIKTACEALGFDLDACYVAFFGSAPVGGATNYNALDAAIAANEHENEETADRSEENMEHIDAKPDAGAFEGRDPDEVIAELLAPASVHMTPHLASMLPGLIRPMIEAAVMGPRVVVQTVVETVDANGARIAPVAPVEPSVNVVRKVSLRTAFDLRLTDIPVAYRYAHNSLMMDVCDYANAPAIDPDYCWNGAALAQIAAQEVMGLNAWIYGAAGTGKTEGARQFAARLGRPFVRIALERTTEPLELIGQDSFVNGTMVWRDGKLTQAFRVPYCVILIDEPSLLRSGTLSAIGTALDTREIYLATGEVVRPAKGVFIIAGDNTAGCGDDTGRYVDTAPLSAAFMDRFSLKTPFDFLPATQETSMIAARTGVHPVAVQTMVNYANLTRKDAVAGKLTIGVTTRRLLSWARTAKAGVPSKDAFHGAIITGAAPEDKETLLMLATTSLALDHDRIDNIVRGLIDPLAPIVDPKAQGAVGATALQFPDIDP